jgi:hypothetical protein
MGLLRRESVLPLNGQVQFGDALATDYPDWATGEERVVFNSQVIAVATRGDVDGNVQIEVWKEPVQEDLEGLEVLDVEIQLIGDIAHFGNALAGDLHEVRLGRGWYQIRVLVVPVDSCPSIVRFIVKTAHS